VRAGTSACLGCVAFLWAYAALHLAHVAGFDPAPVRAIGSIPLFSIFVASAAVAVVSGVLAALAFGRAPERVLKAVPRLLAVSIVGFGVAMLLFP
jgi:hypothetical protein